MNFRYIDETISEFHLAETVEERDIRKLFEIFGTVAGKSVDEKLIRELSAKADKKSELFLPRTLQLSYSSCFQNVSEPKLNCLDI